MISGGRIPEPEAHPGFRFGVGLRRRHYQPLLALPRLPGLDFFEVIPENFLGFGGLARRALAEARARVPVVTHGIGLSLGGPDPLDEAYLEQLRGLLDELDVPWHSEHISLSSGHGVEYHDLLPVPQDQDTLARMAARAEAARGRLGRPLLLENPTVYSRLPGGELPESEFVAGLLEASGCRLLLDLNNLWVNCRNHGGDPIAYLEALPPDSVGQVHLAGHRVDEPLVVDSHGGPVGEEVRELYRLALRRFGPAWTLLEWDQDVPPLEELLEELAELRALAAEALRAPEISVHLPAQPPLAPLPPGDPSRSAATLHEVVLGERAPEAAASELGIPEAGLRLYRNFFRRHHREILERPYRVLFSLLPEELAEEMVRGYQAAHPMSHREINANAAAFPGWLAEQVEAGSSRLGEFHVELALVERARFEAYAHSAELAGEGLNPTLAVLQLETPVADYLDAWSANRAAGEPPPPVPEARLETPEVLFVYRHPESLEGRLARGTPRLLFALKMLHEGLGCAEAGSLAGRDEAYARDALAAARHQGIALDLADEVATTSGRAKPALPLQVPVLA